MKPKLFGTDGIRGQANVEPMSVDTILRVGRAAASVFRQARDQRHTVLIGKDTRVSGYMFEQALASGLCSMGVDVLLVGPMPTPGIAFLTTEMRTNAGVVISASHNPYQDNGIKFFGPDGFKLDDQVEAAIEQLTVSTKDLDKDRPEATRVGKTYRLDDARGRYITYLKHRFPRDLSLDGLKIVLDCANGATYKIAPYIFSELGADVLTVGVNPDGRNINENCGALNHDELKKQVSENSADIGIALDGDGDRVVICDENGKVYDGDDILAILSAPMQDRGELGKGVVGTVMSNFGLERHFKGQRIPFYRSNVGDRHVVEKMRSSNAMLGGEPSGHIVCLAQSTTGDGILTAILLLAELRRKNRALSSYSKCFERCPQELRNVQVKDRVPFEKNPSRDEDHPCGRGKVKRSGSGFGSVFGDGAQG